MDNISNTRSIQPRLILAVESSPIIVFSEIRLIRVRIFISGGHYKMPRTPYKGKKNLENETVLTCDRRPSMKNINSLNISPASNSVEFSTEYYG